LSYDDCIQISEKSDKGISFDMTRDEFNDIMNNRGKVVPSRIPLRWKCIEKKHEWWAPVDNIRKGYGCFYCLGSRPIVYEDCIRIAEESDKNISFDMTKDEFNDIMNDRGKVAPSRVPLKWKCTAKGHYWWTIYAFIQSGYGCPYCGERKKVVGNLAHPILEYLSILYLRLYRCKVRQETRIDPASYKSTIIDLIIKREENFIINIEKFQKIVEIPVNITDILVDFTLSVDHLCITDKCYRMYQSDTKFLIIVLFLKKNEDSAVHAQELIQNLTDIKNKDNIKVIDFNQYLQFLNLFAGVDNWRTLSKDEIEILNKFKNIISLISDSINSDKKLQDLINLSNYYKALLGDIS